MQRNAAVETSFVSAGTNDLDKNNDDDVSDISEDEDFLQGDGDGQHHIASMKKYRVFWTQPKEEYLLRCYNHYRITSSSDHGLKGKSWRRIAVRMTQEFHEEYDSKSCRNKMNVLRYDYANYKSVLEARAANKENEEFWANLISKSPRAAKWRDTEFPYYETLRLILEENGEGVEPLPYLEIQELPVNHVSAGGAGGGGAVGAGGISSAMKKRPRESSIPTGISPRKRPNDGSNGGNPTGDLNQQMVDTLDHHHAAAMNMSSNSNNNAAVVNAANAAVAANAAAISAATAAATSAAAAATQAQSQTQRLIEQMAEILLDKMRQGFDSVAEVIKTYRYIQGNEEKDIELIKNAMDELNKERYSNIMTIPMNREKIFRLLKDVTLASDFMLYPESYRQLFLEDLLNKNK